MPAEPFRRYQRYVAIGDSSTEGLDDPDGNGGYRGWANRFAEQVARAQGGSLLYANLAIRGRLTRQVRDEQLAAAVAMQPDLATVFAGTNDVVARRFDAPAVAADLEHMQHTLVATGATVLAFTLPDLAPVMPLARLVTPRVLALNDALRAMAPRTGAVLVDLAAHPIAADPRLWSPDRIHANSAGHARMAAALAHALGVPGSDDAWALPLPAAARTRRERMVAELSWIGGHLLPWLWRHCRGRSTGDGRMPKRPLLEAVSVDQPSPGDGSAAPERHHRAISNGYLNR